MAEKQIDLHGLREGEAILKFIRGYNAHIRAGSRDPIRVIHGYGSSGKGGVIARALRAYLAANSSRVDKVVEGESLANPGFTLVYPRKLLPEPKPYPKY